jgi:hypothetical protein
MDTLLEPCNPIERIPVTEDTLYEILHQNEKDPAPWAAGSFFRLIRRRPTLPGSLPPSTIGDDELNYRVRNGNGCDFVSMATETFIQHPKRKSGPLN